MLIRIFSCAKILQFATRKMSTELFNQLEDCANRLRITSIETTAAAKSGHPTSSASAAEIVATLFFHEMRYDPKNPKDVNADRLVLSKGHGKLFGSYIFIHFV
jgi:transketolase